MTDVPPPIDYQPPPTDRPTASHPFAQFIVGVGFGVAIVAVGMALAAVPSGTPTPVFIGIALEFTAGVLVTILSIRYRPLGIGLIAAVPVTLLIVFVGCAVIASLNN